MDSHGAHILEPQALDLREAVAKRYPFTISAEAPAWCRPGRRCRVLGNAFTVLTDRMWATCAFSDGKCLPISTDYVLLP